MTSPRFRSVVVAAILLPLDILAAILILLSDILGLPIRLLRRSPDAFPPPDTNKVTLQILNWNGRPLLEECLPRAIEAAGDRHKVVVVDNGSTDGSVEFVRSAFPSVHVETLGKNYGFSVGNNRGLMRASTDIVVLLNNDMLVDRGFLDPLLEGFEDSNVFAVSSRIQMADTAIQPGAETGKTRARFDRGFFYLWHDPIHAGEESQPPSPVFWAGGGFSAYDRRRMASMGGFDALYHPFYVEDVDISYQAWKRGWKSVVAPRSRAIHKHRATSRPNFGDDFVDNTIRRNQFLFVWKNVTDTPMLIEHLLNLPRIHAAGAFERGAYFEIRAYCRALLRLPMALTRRLEHLRASSASDREVLSRQP